ncbi:MAG: ImmA/IrrE family metallo-endopeptidase [Ignavibacteriales bacterium]|nr:ImmA/IrrE family metallo-endopeptidase [Ignavibacteriales bacterium]
MKIVRFSDDAGLNDDPVKAANHFRKKWELDEIKELPNNDAALEGLIEKVEDLSIAVFQLPLTKDNLRGFSIIDEEIPIIVIKRGGDPATAKIFTLFHEVGHLLLNEAGICDVGFGNQQKIEKWCNAFASEILVPKK